jgi:hypothetical protein
MATSLRSDSAPVNNFPPPWVPLSLEWWAEWWGVDVRTIREWIDKFGIKFCQPGRDRRVTPADFFDRVPWVDPRNPKPSEE